MTLKRFFLAGILGIVMSVCVYYGLFALIFESQVLSIAICAFLYFSTMGYLAYIHHPKSFAQFLSPALGILFLLFCASLLSLVLLGVGKLFAPSLLEFEKFWAIGLSLLASLASLYALFEALHSLKLYTQKLKIANLSTPLKVLQLSDLHIGGKYLTEKRLLQIVKKCNELEPDVICLTGDIIDAPSQSMSSQTRLLKKLKAKYGVFYVLGNHEYFYDVDNLLKEISDLGIKTLVNESVVLEIDSHPVLNIAGIADFNAEQYQKLYPQKQFVYPDIQRTLQSLKPNLPSILLSHQPKIINLLPSPSPFALILSGHTHGGQIFPFNFLVKLEQPLLKGLYTINNTFVYVNQGTAFWGIPMRLGSKCEITLLKLEG